MLSKLWATLEKKNPTYYEQAPEKVALFLIPPHSPEYNLTEKTWVHIKKHLKRVWDKSLTLNIKSEQNELSDIQNSILFAFFPNLSILKIYNKEFLKSKSFCPSLFTRLFRPILVSICCVSHKKQKD